MIQTAAMLLATVAAAAPSPGGEAGAPRLVVANADGVLDAAAAVPPAPADPLPNPFKDRTRVPRSVRELAIKIGAVLVRGSGAANAAVIDGKVCSPGDDCDGFTLAAVSAEYVELDRNGLRLQVPVRDGPVKVRLPF
jgi:hypothetical protein